MDNKTGLLFRYRIWWHILFWIVWYFFYIITYSYGTPEKVQFLQNLYLLPVRMAATYLLLYWILPKFLLRRKYFLFTVIAAVHAVLFGLSIWFVLYLATDMHYRETLPFIRPIVLNYQIPATAAAIYMFKRWYLIQQYSLNLEKEKLEAELKFLKSQIHPHFLFNTLNNLYALTLKKSDLAPDMVIQLSNLLEYMLYTGKESEVKLTDELNQIMGYIDLEKLRFGKRLKIILDIDDNFDDLLIAPLILLPFVENSFKHGPVNDHKSPFISLKAKTNNRNLHFTISNSYQNEAGKFEKYTERIGLKNVRRRLELIYPQRHQLVIKQEHDNFKVDLKLDLNTIKNKARK
ncbi:MAG TPA: histidine kinase [Bacteroidales bacterium]|nr:histidine kinase [Bacteroidales bacterium]